MIILMNQFISLCSCYFHSENDETDSKEDSILSSVVVYKIYTRIFLIIEIFQKFIDLINAIFVSGFDEIL